MSHQVNLVERPAQPALIIHTHSPVQNLTQVLGQCYGAIMQHMGQLGQQPGGTPFVAYYNMDMDNLEIEVGIPTTTALPGKDTVQSKPLPAGKAITYLYVGPYAEIMKGYEVMNKWLTDQGLHGTGVAYEFYLNDPAVFAPEALQTEIVMPLKAE